MDQKKKATAPEVTVINRCYTFLFCWGLCSWNSVFLFWFLCRFVSPSQCCLDRRCRQKCGRRATASSSGRRQVKTVAVHFCLSPEKPCYPHYSLSMEIGLLCRSDCFNIKLCIGVDRKVFLLLCAHYSLLMEIWLLCRSDCFNIKLHIAIGTDRKVFPLLCAHYSLVTIDGNLTFVEVRLFQNKISHCHWYIDAKVFLLLCTIKTSLVFQGRYSSVCM